MTRMVPFFISIWMVFCSLQLHAGQPGDLGRGRFGDVLYVHQPPDPVNVRTRNFYLPVQDYYLPCFGFPLEVYRSYNSISTREGPFGKGWTFNYDLQIVVGEDTTLRVIESDGFLNEYRPLDAPMENKAKEIELILEARKKEDVQYLGKPEGKGVAFYEDIRKKLEKDAVLFARQRERYLSALTKISKTGKYISEERGKTFLEKTKDGFLRTTETGRKEEYNSKGLLTRVSDRNNNELTLVYSRESRLERVNDGCGQWIEFLYNDKGKIHTARDSLSRSLLYGYDAKGRLTSAQGLDEKVNYAYDTADRMSAIQFSDGTKTEMTYDPKTGDVLKQSGPGTKVTTYQYGKDGSTVWALVTDNEGGKSRYDYVEADHKIIFTDKNGKKTTTSIMACCGKPLSIKNDKGVGDEFAYDSKGNLLKKKDAQNRTTSFEYDPRFNLPSKITEKDGTLSYRYDTDGNLVFANHSSQTHVKISYEPHGKIQDMVDHLDNTISFKYNLYGLPIRIEKKSKNRTLGVIETQYTRGGEVLRIDFTPKDPLIYQGIKDTMLSMLRLLKPSGIEFDL